MASPTKSRKSKKQSAATKRTAKSATAKRAVAAIGTGEVDRRRAFAMVMDLMAIAATSGHEAPVADYIRSKLLSAGAPPAAIRNDNAHKKSPLPGDVGNLIFQLPGTVRAPRRLLMAHMDTVPVCVGARPVKKGDVVRSANPATGLGADDRAGVAVVLNTAVEILTRDLPHPPLTFFFPVQEEVGLHGAQYAQLSLLGKPRLAFNWDGGAAERVTIAATGGYRLQIEISGLAAHAGVAPQQGISAIAIASLAIARLVRDGWHGLVEKEGRRGTSNVGYIHGGEATNVVTDRVEIKAEARGHDRAFRQQIVAAIEDAFRAAAKEIRNEQGKCGSVQFKGRTDYEAFSLNDDDPSVAAAYRAVRAAGLEPQPAVSNGGLDANWMTAHGIPTVTLGCGQNQIHTTSEWLEIAAFERACRIALALATEID